MTDVAGVRRPVFNGVAKLFANGSYAISAGNLSHPDVEASLMMKTYRYRGRRIGLLFDDDWADQAPNRTGTAMTRREGLPFFDGVVAWSIDHPLPLPARYIVATMLIVAIAVLRATVITSLVPWLLFIPVILVIGLTLAEAPALYGSLLAAVLAGYSLADPSAPLWLTAPQWAGSLLFLLVAVLTSFLAGELRAGVRRARQLAAELTERASFLSGVLASSTDCIQVLDFDGRLTFMSEGE